jgi:hypothetical protein
MVTNHQWPFENVGREFFDTIPRELEEPMEDMLHHVQPGLSTLATHWISTVLKKAIPISVAEPRSRN